MLHSKGHYMRHNIIRTDVKQIPIVDQTIYETHRNNLSDKALWGHDQNPSRYRHQQKLHTNTN